ncbi:MAG TPA: NAD(P)H-hydrate dehydratase, partial [Methylomirabilota bacterium]|nr:NAD(P)H-hydrate dehydratase [Methylomirabilota bacterium]
ADALNAFEQEPAALVGREGRDLIITPHPGEMARLVGLSTHEVQANRLTIARDFATAHHLYVILKGHRTLIATPGGAVFINPTGNPGMAKGGSGDVLTGIVGALLAREIEPAAALRAGCYAHGLAADVAVRERGEYGMLASDIIESLPAALRALAEGAA